MRVIPPRELQTIWPEAYLIDSSTMTAFRKAVAETDPVRLAEAGEFFLHVEDNPYLGGYSTFLRTD